MLAGGRTAAVTATTVADARASESLTRGRRMAMAVQYTQRQTPFGVAFVPGPACSGALLARTFVGGGYLVELREQRREAAACRIEETPFVLNGLRRCLPGGGGLN